MVLNALLLQRGVGGLGVVQRGAVNAAGLGEDAAVVFFAQCAGAARAGFGQGKGQGFDIAVFRLAVEPFGIVGVGGHFALPQAGHHLGHMLAGDAKSHAAAAAAGEHAKHQARAFGRTTVHMAPHFERAVPAKDAGMAAFQVLELRSPDERAIGKHPQILLATPFVHGSLEHVLGAAVAGTGGRFRHGFVNQQYKVG